MSNKSVGQRGETIAAEYLLKQGYKILETNKRFSRFCEIDIIALEKNTLVFIEVKTRRTNYCGEPIEAITMSKFHNIKIGNIIDIDRSNFINKIGHYIESEYLALHTIWTKNIEERLREIHLID